MSQLSFFCSKLRFVADWRQPKVSDKLQFKQQNPPLSTVGCYVCYSCTMRNVYSVVGSSAL